MCIVSIVNIALTAVLADDQNFKISIVDEKFSSARELVPAENELVPAENKMLHRGLPCFRHTGSRFGSVVTLYRVTSRIWSPDLAARNLSMRAPFIFRP